MDVLLKLKACEGGYLSQAEMQDVWGSRCGNSQVSMLAAAKAFSTKVYAAIHIVERCLAVFKAEANEVALSFNGGKDSTVVMHLIRAAVAQAHMKQLEKESAAEGTSNNTKAHAKGGASAPSFSRRKNRRRRKSSARLKPLEVGPIADASAKVSKVLSKVLSFYFLRGDEFEEEVTFVEETFAKYNLRRRVIRDGFRVGMENIIHKDGVRAVIMGTRDTDPDASTLDGPFYPSTEGWPPFMRVNPILEWSYSDVWDFLRICKIEYCELYDKGFTSIGNRRSTVANPALRKKYLDDTDVHYHPAWTLVDGSMERLGRRQSAASSAEVAAGAKGGPTKTVLQAVIDDDEDSLRLCLATVPMPDLEETNADEESALHIVAGRGRLDMLKLLLDAGADPNCEDDFGRSALRHCVEVHKDSFGADQLSCMTALLSAGADPNLSCDYGWIPLHKAAQMGYIEAVHVLLAAGSNPAETDKGGQTAYMKAQQNGHDAIAALVQGVANGN
eukprot:g716.t1